ncbi:MAG: hypothetical protein COV76_08040 [Candidatus Omnitrophica bacterium CG11_big_fil_rev_8_21_14_0_20_64_10]|nr:MAG: hypothetical protein COV76_08040 [Candidatus Omnitrophica bacterium CG11_big_fil_rev_8_21_14_0_20_64_10]
MNPWFSIWTAPRRTMREILDRDSVTHPLGLAFLGGIATALISWGPILHIFQVPFQWGVVGSAGVGAFCGIVGLYVWGWLFRVVGGWFGGQGNNGQVRMAIAWPYLISIWLAGAWLLVGGVSRLLFHTAPYGGIVRVSVSWLFVALAQIALIWKFVAVCLTLAEAHRFSGGKGFATIFLTQMVIQTVLVVPFVLVTGILASIAIPNFQAAIVKAKERQAALEQPATQLRPLDQAGMTAHMESLRQALESYRSGSGAGRYPETLADLGTIAAPEEGSSPLAGQLEQVAHYYGYEMRYLRTGPETYVLMAIPGGQGWEPGPLLKMETDGVIRAVPMEWIRQLGLNATQEESHGSDPVHDAEVGDAGAGL